MINYNRLGYEIKRDLTAFSTKFSLQEDIKLKKTIERLSRNLNSFEEKQSVMRDYLSLVKQHVKEDCAVIVMNRRFDANEYYRYFLKHNERFVIRSKKNRRGGGSRNTSGSRNSSLNWRIYG